MKDLLFGIHLHQPVDNLQSAVDEAVNKCYAPLFETLGKFPEFKFSLHCSGWLFEVLKNSYTDVFENIKKCNAEFFTAGFYEPVLCSIPKEDRILQIKKLNAFLKENFSVSAKGMWLTERVWCDDIINETADLGIEYIIIDDYHIKIQSSDEIKSYYLTEYNGKKTALFPISKNLRYSIPFKPVKEALEIIKKEKFAVIFDDAEKFGLWPNTYDWVYKQKWLEHFIQEVLESDISPVFFQDYYKNNNAQGLIYLQKSSYEEMEKWSLKTNDALIYENLKTSLPFRFLRGGIWKNFFIKYEESNHLHKRMLQISKKIKNGSLLKLQTNDVYWHGIFGGLYLPNLRDNAYRYLIECENQLNPEEIQKEDFNFDGREEIKINKKNYICILNHKGEIIEFDDRKNLFNFQNTLARRKEFYHIQNNKTSKHSGIKTIHEMDFDIQGLNPVFDTHLRHSFIDNVFENFDLEAFKKEKLPNLLKNAKSENSGLEFIKNKNGISLKKNFFFDDNINFEITAVTNRPLIYCMEFNLHFAGYKNLDINKSSVYDPFTQRNIDFIFDKEFESYDFEIYTVNKSENGFENTIQGICKIFIFKIENKSTIKGKICLK